MLPSKLKSVVKFGSLILCSLFAIIFKFYTQLRPLFPRRIDKVQLGNLKNATLSQFENLNRIQHHDFILI